MAFTCAKAATIAALFSGFEKSVNASFTNSPRCRFTAGNFAAVEDGFADGLAAFAPPVVAVDVMD
jgi:hypothetical protein